MSITTDSIGHGLEQTKNYVEHESWQAGAAISAWSSKEGQKLTKASEQDKSLSFLRPIGEILSGQTKESTAAKVGIAAVVAAATFEPGVGLAAAAVVATAAAEKHTQPTDVSTRTPAPVPEPGAAGGHASDSSKSTPPKSGDNAPSKDGTVVGKAATGAAVAAAGAKAVEVGAKVAQEGTHLAHH